MCESGRAVKWAVQNNILNCLEWLITRVRVRIVGVRAVPGGVFISKGIAS